MNRKIILIGLLVLCLTATVVWPADSKQPVADREQNTTPVTKPVSPLADQVPWLSINDGGALNMTSTNYKVSATIGQTAIGYGNGANHDMGLGYWYGACAARPGDANASGTYTIGDVVAMVNYIFPKPGWPPCSANSTLCWLSGLLCRGDWNASGTVTVGDVIQAVNFVFNKPPGGWNAKAIGACCLP